MSAPLQRTVTVITAEYLPDATIEEVAYSMCDLAAQTSCYVKFVYEGIEMVVSFHHTDEEILKEWRMRKSIIDKIESIDPNDKNAVKDLLNLM